MSEPIFWTNVGVSVSSALSEEITITGISKEAEAVVSYQGDAPTELADGAVIWMKEINGMMELGERAFIIKSHDAMAKTFVLKAEDTTDYGSFTGTAKAVVATMGADFRSIQDVSASGGDFEKADVTVIHGLLRRRRATVANPVTFSFTNLFDLGDPGFKECVKAHRSKTNRVIMFSFGTGPKILAVGAPAATGVPTGQAQGVVQTPVEIECQGVPTPVPATV